MLLHVPSRSHNTSKSPFTRLQDAATQRFPPSTQAFILEVRKARDAAMGDLDKVKKERDQLRERLRVSTIG